MNWISQHIPHILGTGAAGGSAVVVLFRDELRAFFRDRRDSARLERDTKLTQMRLENDAKNAESARHDSVTMKTLGMIEENLKEERLSRAKMQELLERLTIAVENGLKADQAKTAILAHVDKRLGHIEGALRIQ